MASMLPATSSHAVLSHSPSIPILVEAIQPRSRTSSLLRSASSMTLFGGKNRLASVASTDKPASGAQGTGTRFSAFKGKGKDGEATTLLGGIMSRPALVSLSGNASTPSGFRPFSRKRRSENPSAMSSYRERAGTFSKSSPDLGTMDRTSLAAWSAALAEADGSGRAGRVESADAISADALSAANAAEVRAMDDLDLLSTMRYSPTVHGDSITSAKLHDESPSSSSAPSLRLNSQSPSPHHGFLFDEEYLELSRSRSASPPAAEEGRQAVYAHALAKLTAGSKSDPHERRFSVVEEDDEELTPRASQSPAFDSRVTFLKRETRPLERNPSSKNSPPWLQGSPPVIQRRRHSSDLARPVQQRSVSLPETVTSTRPAYSPRPSPLVTFSSAPPPSLSQLPSTSKTPSPVKPVPFPSTTPPSAAAPVDSIGLGFPPSRPRQHKRWNSEVHIEQAQVARESFPGPRSRHKSLQLGSPDDIKVTRVTRTKLVLREEGRPTLTYQLGECIGRGQFGAVFRALNLNSGRVVAVKRILLEGKSEEEVRQLSQEVSLLKRLVHPGVVKYEGVVRTEHYINIILEYIENGSLQKTIKHFGDLPEELVASYVVKILDGLDYLHTKQVVHCDLKAANILSTKTGNIKLSDFGVSLNLNAVQNLRDDVNDVAGTPNWMAPEIIELKGASTASDIWSLGCTIIELITGKPPYAGMLPMAVLFRIVEDERPPIPPHCSLELVDFLSHCFAKDPRDRPTAKQLAQHVWVKTHWDLTKEVRPEDSIPFLRRISTDFQRPPLDHNGLPLDPNGPLPLNFAFMSHPPVKRPSLHSEGSRRLSTQSRLSSEGHGARVSFDTGVRQQPSRISSSPSSFGQSMPQATDETFHLHSFVKTTFSKAVECKICHDQTKRNAVLCQDCGLISHARCVEWAPLPCDLRSQLLGRPRSSPPLPRATRSSSPSSSALSGLAIVMPFSKTRRSKTALPDSPLSLSPTPSPGIHSNALHARPFFDRSGGSNSSALPQARDPSDASNRPRSLTDGERETDRNNGSVGSAFSGVISFVGDDVTSPNALNSVREGFRSAISLIRGSRTDLEAGRSSLEITKTRTTDSHVGPTTTHSGGDSASRRASVQSVAPNRLQRSRSRSKSVSRHGKKESMGDCSVQ